MNVFCVTINILQNKAMKSEHLTGFDKQLVKKKYLARNLHKKANIVDAFSQKIAPGTIIKKLKIYK